MRGWRQDAGEALEQRALPRRLRPLLRPSATWVADLQDLASYLADSTARLDLQRLIQKGVAPTSFLVGRSWRRLDRCTAK